MRLSNWDYVIIGVYLVGIVAIGLFFSRRQKSLKEYFLASGSVKWWAVSISMFATALSPLSFLGATGWVFSKDSRYIIGGTVVGIITTVVGAFIWVPLWNRLQLQSIYTYLERRYHPAIRSFGATIFPISMIFWVGNALVSAAMAFQAVTGVEALHCIIFIVALGTVYTMMGGARAVIWTDVAQFAVFVFAFILMGFLLLQYFNWQPMQIYNIASSVISKKTGYSHTTLFSTEFSLAIEGTIWSIAFAGIFSMLSSGTQQVTVQRLMAAGGRRNMFKAMFGSAFVSAIFISMSVLVSWGLVAFYHQNPDIKATMDHPDQVVAHYVVGYVPMLIRGVIIAGLLAAMMSTFDSALNSMSSVTINDFYKRYFARNRSEHHYVNCSRYFTLAWGVVVLGFALWQLDNSGSTALERMGKLNVLLAAPIICFFVMGLLFKRVNAPGALIGGVGGIVVALTFNGFPGLFKSWINHDINWMWISGFSTLASFVIAYFASIFFPRTPPEKLEGLTLFTGRKRKTES
jgi:solute:Na+ symporter, SSS family